VAALLGALAAALSSMVANLTHGKREYESVRVLMEEVACEVQYLKDLLLGLMDANIAVFNRVIESYGLLKRTEDEKIRRSTIIEKATKEAARIPLTMMGKTFKTMELT
jgi:formiminotetrahydrofolate cyclodeaminase